MSKMAGALTLMTIVALIGVVGSWLIGAIDQKIGTKKTMQGFGIWYAIALVINVLSGGHVGMLFYLSIFMIGMGTAAPPTSRRHCRPPSSEDRALTA